MKVKIFAGRWYDAQDAFNKWAHCKTLGKDVIIHEQVMYSNEVPSIQWLLIIVYHPEGSQWDKTELQPNIPEYTAIEDEKDAKELEVTA
jgi:hypothetical protein